MKIAEEIIRTRMLRIGKQYIADLDTTYIVDMMEEYARQVKNCSMPDVVLRSEQLADQKRYCNDCGDYVGKGCDNEDCKDFKVN